MVIKDIRLQNVRSHKDKTIKLNENVTIITGPNGSGKTTILEAIYYTLQGKSFKGSDAEILKNDELWWKIVASTKDGQKSISYDSSKVNQKKKFMISDHTTYRMLSKNKYPVVLFEPEDLRLLNGSPARRRRFLDVFISQLDSNYQASLRKYERALKQRNNLLKKTGTSEDDLFVWNIALSEHGAYIIKQRVGFIEKINNSLNEVYNKIAKTKDNISAHYSHTLIEHNKQKLYNELEKSFERDKILGITTTGPHRHDVMFKFNNQPALKVASRGEIRTIILALKFIEVDIIKILTGQDPVILLDDVFSELDKSRQKSLSELTKNHQVIITAVEK